ncbi:hypothetical protein CH338_30560, partial [Rhodoplanes elegans]
EARDAEPTVVPDAPEPPAFEPATDAAPASAIAEAAPHREPEVILGVPFGEVGGQVQQDSAPQDLDALAAASADGPMPPPAAIAAVAPPATDWPPLPRQPARIEPAPAAPTFAAPPVAELVRADEVPAAQGGAAHGRAAVVWLIPDTEPVRTAPPRPEPPRAARTEPLLIADSPAMVPSAGDPGGFGWLKPRPFAGDLAVRELGRRLALDPHAVPEPPMPVRVRVPWRGAGIAAALTGVAAALALAVVVVLIPSAGREAAGPALAGAPSDRALMAGLERAAPVRLVLVE